MTISRLSAAVGAVAVFAAGAAASYWWTTKAPAAPARVDTTAPGSIAPQQKTPPAGAIPIAPDLAKRAGIVIESVRTSPVAGSVRVPGTVQPNAYRQVSVTPLVGGRVTKVLVQQGQTVVRGAPIAEIYSPEVAEVRARYLSARADIDAGDAKLRRTERLAALGSASQQELEQVRAEHVRHEVELREAAARLRLLGFDPSRITDPHADSDASTVAVKAPQAGVIVQRPATAGMTAEPSTVLATLADLSPVWVVADLYERDFARVAIGASATVTAAAYPGVEFHGRVTYVSPEVRPETRTAQVRIELANPRAFLRFGMYVDAVIGAQGRQTVVVPRSAVQMIGPDPVVFVPDNTEGNSFRERRIVLGEADGDRLAVVEGLSSGELVVTQGSFVVRAEAERLGIRPTLGGQMRSAPADASPAQELSVKITARGFEPDSLVLKAGVRARVTFTRTTDETCAKEVVFPDYGLRRALPLNEPVVVEFVPAARDAAFQCGMGMLSGKLIVR
ncbi:MAG TPA: efflux RND transporter periplasmic adaptor subunit [Vicinamibacterales bacterium]|nr:efflux RND transporter periplasmic adaptor subunit [Vicinamibacterales bacterium]